MPGKLIDGPGLDRGFQRKKGRRSRRRGIKMGFRQIFGPLIPSLL